MTGLEAIKLTKLAPECVKVELFTDEVDFHIRVWNWQIDYLKSFLSGSTSRIGFSECIFDVDQHYNDLDIYRTPNGICIYFSDYSNISDNFYRGVEVNESEGLAFVSQIINLLETQ